MIQDIRYATRALRTSPAFTAAAVLSLALGIGANTAIFSIVDTLLLRPLPVHDPKALTVLGSPRATGRFDPAFSGPEFRDVRDHRVAAFSSVSAMVLGGSLGPTGRADGLTVESATEPVQTMFVSGQFFEMLGIHPHLGRLILPAEGDVPGGDPVVVLGYDYWQSRFHGDRAVVGKPAAVNGRPVTIIGVAPEGFRGPTPIVDMQAYLPLGMMTVETDGNTAFWTDAATRELFLVGRLATGVTLEQANGALAPLAPSLLQRRARSGTAASLRAWPLRPPGIVNGPNPLPALAGLFFMLAGVVFALACLNVANLTMVRAAGRGREIAIRAALGSSRTRLVRHLLSESALVALLGAAAGLIVSWAALRELTAAVVATGLPIAVHFSLNPRVFLFALAVSCVAAATIGIVPAIRASGGGLSPALRNGGRTTGGRSQRLRAALVAMQVTGSFALLIVAGLFVRSLHNVERSDLGFDPDRVLNVRLDPGEVGFAESRARAFYGELLDKVRMLPGVSSASLTTAVPLGDATRVVDIDVAGYVPRQGESVHADYNAVSPAYFATMRIRMLEGRDFTDADASSRTGVAIINQAMAARFWPNGSSIGRTFFGPGGRQHPLQIVGVVANSRIDDPYSPYGSAVYVPFAQAYTSGQTLQIRTTGPPEALAQDVLSIVRAIAPQVPVLNVRTMTDAVANGDSGFFIFNVGAQLTGALGVLGLALALIGIYGVMAYAVGQRVPEIGVRMALGAQRSSIFWLVSRQGIVILAVGLGCGAGAAIAVGKLVGDFLVGIAPTDPVTYLLVGALLTVVGLAACYVPTRRALRVDPVIALRRD